MYCKWWHVGGGKTDRESINSSKVYCKFNFFVFLVIFTIVLIVAKCIVNVIVSLSVFKNTFVLIVAKCIVNFGILTNAQVTAKY